MRFERLPPKKNTLRRKWKQRIYLLKLEHTILKGENKEIQQIQHVFYDDIIDTRDSESDFFSFCRLKCFWC